MLKTTQPDTPDLAAADAAAENLLRNPGSTNLANIDPARESALDDAFASITTPDAQPGEIGRDNGGVPVPVTGAPTPEPAATEPEVTPKPEEKPADTAPAPKPVEKPAEKPARKGLLDDVIDEPAPQPENKPEEAYDDITLRSDASDKTKSSFDVLKSRAVERENAVREELNRATARAQELEAKLAETEKKIGAIPEPVEKEIKELREFRALHDVTSRPEFREKFDARIDTNFEAIYAILKQEGWDDSKVQALKNIPETQRVEFIEKKLVPLLTDGQKRVVEAKIYDNVNVAEEKNKAIAQARAEADKIIAEQREAPLKQQQQRDVEFANVLRPRLQKLPFLYFREIPATATPAQKVEIEAHNAFAKELQDDVGRAITDKSPEIQAEVILAVPLARHLKRVNAALEARAKAAEEKLAAITKAGSTSRLGRSASAPLTPAAPARGTDTSGDSAIDGLFQEVTSSRPTT